ncbi:MAG: hypothetical protein ACRD0Q_10685 [Acidimicrobiales bacterium]
MRHPQYRRWIMVFAMGALVAGCVTVKSDGDGVSSTTEVPATSSTVPAPAYERPSAPRTVGTGFVVGTSIDGTAVYVEQEDSAFPQPGCEGQPQPVLFRLPLDGGRRELLATPDLPVRGQVVRGPAGRVAVVDGCEGFLSRVLVGTETPDGHLQDLRQVPIPESGSRPNPLSLSWSRDGASLLGAQASASGSSRVVRIDPATGAVTSLFPVPGVGRIVLRVAELDGGAIAVVGGGRVEVLGADGRTQSTAEGNDFTIAPDGRSLLVFGRAIARLEAGGRAPVPVAGAEAGREITSAELSPDGRAVVYVTSADGGADNRVRLVLLASRQVVEATGPGQWGRAEFTGDGRAVVFNQFFPAPRFVPDVVLAGFGT